MDYANTKKWKKDNGYLEPGKSPKCSTCTYGYYGDFESLTCEEGNFTTKPTAWCKKYKSYHG